MTVVDKGLVVEFPSAEVISSTASSQEMKSHKEVPSLLYHPALLVFATAMNLLLKTRNQSLLLTPSSLVWSLLQMHWNNG